MLSAMGGWKSVGLVSIKRDEGCTLPEPSPFRAVAAHVEVLAGVLVASIVLVAVVAAVVSVTAVRSSSRQARGESCVLVVAVARSGGEREYRLLLIGHPGASGGMLAVIASAAVLLVTGS